MTYGFQHDYPDQSYICYGKLALKASSLKHLAMQTACLYIRVSTDEQAQKGFSQRNQEEILRKYCVLYNIRVLDAVFEDHSAKTFKRPQWSKLLTGWQSNKSTVPDLVLFTRWDRFSRKSIDAHLMLLKLQKLKVRAQAIEQMLDLSIPEHKIMLALYLAEAEVENDKKSLSISQNMHKARKEGRWPGRAPIGYSNRITVSGDKYIAPHEPEATMIRKAFELIASNTCCTHHVYQQAVKAGLKCSRSNFWELIRNPVYCGRVFVPPFGSEKSYTVKGVHEKLISVVLFEQVQGILRTNGRIKKPKVTFPDQLPLRGFLLCPLCHKVLTGSGSKGNSKRYFYYHCSGKCPFRIRADYANNKFQSQLEKLVARPPYVHLYHLIVADIHKEMEKKQSFNQVRISKDIENAMARTIRAKDLLHRGDIDYDDYIVIKESCNNRVSNSCKELQEHAVSSAEANKNIREKTGLLSRINDLFNSTDILGKRQLLQLFFPQKMTLNKKGVELIPSEAAYTIYGFKGQFCNSLLDKTYLEIPAKKMEEYLKIAASTAKNTGSINSDRMTRIIQFLRKLALFTFKRHEVIF